ncbi:hypothetical protein LEMLEM_LOCUS12992 [Lemmus lemmus]
MVPTSRSSVLVPLLSTRVPEAGFGFMSAAFICLPKISPCRHAEGRKTRRAVFLGPLILTTCLRGKVDGPGTEAVRHYVPGSRTCSGHAAGSLLLRRPSGHGGALACGHPRQRHATGLQRLGHPLVQVSSRASWRNFGCELGKWLFGGHQAAAETLLQRGDWLPPPGAPQRPDQWNTRGEPLQSAGNFHGRAGCSEPLRCEKHPLHCHEQ